MAKLRIEIATAERLIYTDEVDLVLAPGIEGQLGILPHHAPLMTMLEPGELLIRKGSEEISLSITGGFIEVRPDKVIILADACEREEEIDIARAEAAKRRAEERLKEKPAGTDIAQAQAALHRALIRLKVAGKRRRKSPTIP